MSHCTRQQEQWLGDTQETNLNLLAITQRFHQSFHPINHNSCNQTLSNLHEFSWLEKPLSEDHRPHGHQPQASAWAQGGTLCPHQPTAPKGSILLSWDHR